MTLLATAAVGIVAIVLLGPSGLAPPILSTTPDPWTAAASVTSPALGREMRIEVFVPQVAGSERLPVLFLFHGRGGDETQWMAGHFGDGVGIDRLAHELIDKGEIEPVVIVSSNIDDSYGVDSEASADGYSHGPYATYILEELVPQVEARYVVGGTPATRGIGGLSMGGFAALNAGLGQPGMFGSIAALSPAFFVDAPRDRSWIYGAQGERDPARLADAPSSGQLNVFLGMGDRDYDWIQEATRGLAARLAARGLALEPVVVPGGHDISTWRQLAGPMLKDLFPVPA